MSTAPSDDDAPLEVGDASLTAVLLARRCR